VSEGVWSCRHQGVVLRVLENGDLYFEGAKGEYGPTKPVDLLSKVPEIAESLGVRPPEIVELIVQYEAWKAPSFKPLVFEEENLRITIRNEDGVRVPASQLYYRNGGTGSFIIGELTYAYATVNKTVRNKRGEEEEIEYETIEPVLVWAYYNSGALHERLIKPWRMAKTLEVEGRPVMIELRARYTGTLETLISLDTCLKFLDGGKAQPWGDLFSRIREALERFVSFPWDHRLYDVVACWVLGTYFSELFSTYPFLYVYGSQGSGKSRLLLTATYLSRHGFVVTDPSDASLYRVAEAFRPTMGIDESLLGKQAWKLIRTAFKKGLKVPRVEKTSREEFVLALFETYMPVAFASTERPIELGGSEADESRALFVFMQRAPDPIGRDPEPHDFTDLRNELYLLRLLKAPDVLEALKKLGTVDLKLYGHDREVWLPIFTIAKLIGEEVFENVKAYAEELIGKMKEFQYVEEKILIGAMYRLLLASPPNLEGEKVAEFKASDLLDHVREELTERGEFQEAVFTKYWTPRRLGRILTRMGLFRRILHGRRMYCVTPETLRGLAERYEYEVDLGGLGVLGGLFLKRGVEENNPPITDEDRDRLNDTAKKLQDKGPKIVEKTGGVDYRIDHTPFKINTPNPPNTPFGQKSCPSSSLATFKCPYCGFQAFTKEDLRAHIQARHIDRDVSLQQALKEATDILFNLTCQAGGPVRPEELQRVLKWNPDFLTRIQRIAFRDRVWYQTPDGRIGVSW